MFKHSQLYKNQSVCSGFIADCFIRYKVFVYQLIMKNKSIFSWFLFSRLLCIENQLVYSGFIADKTFRYKQLKNQLVIKNRFFILKFSFFQLIIKHIIAES